MKKAAGRGCSDIPKDVRKFEQSETDGAAERQHSQLAVLRCEDSLDASSDEPQASGRRVLGTCSRAKYPTASRDAVRMLPTRRISLT